MIIFVFVFLLKRELRRFFCAPVLDGLGCGDCDDVANGRNVAELTIEGVVMVCGVVLVVVVVEFRVLVIEALDSAVVTISVVHDQNRSETASILLL